MQLYEIPLIFALVGLVLYTVLGGADFGAGVWQLTAGGGPRAERIRDHAHNAMAPVWEANHVWLIFVLVIMWTAYPVAFGSIGSTLAIPLFVAAVGIIFRGTTYALRAGAGAARELRVIDTLFALSSILTPFALGAAVGGIASRRVPVGNAAGDFVTSWLNPTSILIGALGRGNRRVPGRGVPVGRRAAVEGRRPGARVPRPRAGSGRRRRGDRVRRPGGAALGRASAL
jgi:cytochrome d ubiquinol oxidase subunit II